MSLWILDDAGEDDTVRTVEDHFRKEQTAGWASLHLHRNESRSDTAFSRHRLEMLARQENPDSLLVLDDDVTLDPAVISSLTGYLDIHPDAAAVGPRILFADRPETDCHRPNFVHPWTARYSELATDRTVDCDWLISACCLFRSADLYAAGGFDPSFVTAHEEVDLCLRLRRAGRRIVYHPETRVWHDVRLSTPKQERLYYLYRNRFLVIQKNFRGIRRLTAVLFGLTFSSTKAVWDAFRRNASSSVELRLILRAFQDGLLSRWGTLS